MQKARAEKPHFSLELVAMVCVIAISSWHVGNYMATFDGWIMATIMGATLGFCNFLMAHNIFKPNSTSRFPSFCGLVFFACTSTYMQYIYFNADPAIGTTMVLGVNLDALALGVWAPAAEILLGWIYAAGLKQSSQARSTQSQATRFGRIGDALTSRIEQRLSARPVTVNRSAERSMREPVEPFRSTELGHVNAPTSGRPALEHAKLNGSEALNSVQLNGAIERNGGEAVVASSPSSNGLNDQVEQRRLSKPEAIEHLLSAYRANPNASYDEVARIIGRSKGTVANYVKELKEAGQVHITDDGVQVTI